jgi:hypothetical protein
MAAWGLGFIELIAGLLMAVWLLSSPPVFRLYYPASGDPARVADATTIVEWLAGQESFTALNSQLTRGALTRKELNHYADVRRILEQVSTAVWLSACVVMALIVAAFKISPDVLQAAQWRGLSVLGILMLASCALAWWDWEVLFAWMHYPLFGPTSWRLSRTAYSLQLFPDSFWQTSTIIVCAFPVLMMLAIATCARLGRLSASGKGQRLQSRRRLKLEVQRSSKVGVC